jgi:hypothetical protein
MTEKPTSKGLEEAQRRRRARVETATKALRELPPGVLVEVILEIFVAQPSPRPGLLEAATMATAALLAPKWVLSEDDAAMVERLAAVGRGARLLTKSQETVNAIREIAPMVDACSRAPGSSEERAELLAGMLEKRFGRSVSAAGMLRVITARRTNGRVAWAALAAGILPGVDEALSDSDTWRESLDVVREALRNKDLVVEDNSRIAPGVMCASPNPRDLPSESRIQEPDPLAGGVPRSTDKKNKIRHYSSEGASERRRRTK